MQAGEVPLPGVRPHEVLVRTHFSFVSMGTEKMKVTQARMNLAAKARERPDQVQAGAPDLQGPGSRPHDAQDPGAPASRRPRSATAAPESWPRSARRSTSSASAIASLASARPLLPMPNTTPCRAPWSRRCRISVSLEAASASAVGAIALQGLRQARLELGMSVAVIGLGLLGQFLVQLCRANGCRVMGVDLDPKKCELALASGAEIACAADESAARSGARRISHGARGGRGLAHRPPPKTTSRSRWRRCLCAIGAASCASAIPRSISIGACGSARRSSSSSAAPPAPASIDPDYFMRGNDYPVGYVRWSAKRNIDGLSRPARAKAESTHRI